MILICALPMAAQQGPADRGPGPGGQGWDRAQGPGGPPPMARPGRGFPGGGSPRWWTDPQVAQRLGLTPEQQKKIADIFQQNRLKLIDLNAGLQREEAILEPLLAEDRPAESKVLPQIDRVAQARAELEKANARMLLGFRSVLTVEQWKKLQADRRQGGLPHNIHRMGQGQGQGPGQDHRLPQHPM